MKKLVLALPLLVFTGCTSPDGQNRYSYKDVGQSAIVEFGTILSSRQVEITGPNSGNGALAGGALGLATGSNVGGGNGQAVGMVAGAIVGAIAGATAEQALADMRGIEYTIIKENGKVITLVQNLNKDDRIIQNNTRVMVQISGSYQRVIPADELPEEVSKPKGINFKSEK